MLLAFTTLGCPQWTLREITAHAAAMGYAGIDWRGLLGVMDIYRLPEFTTDLPATRRLFADHGVAFAGMYASARLATVEPAARQAQLDDARRNLDLAAAVGAPLVRVFGGRVPDGHTAESVFPYVVDGLRQLAEEADPLGVTVALETHDDWTASKLGRRVMEAVDHPRARLLWDMHHTYRAGGETPDASLALIGSYVARVHVKDSRLNPDGGFTYCLLGEGDVPLQRGLDRLRAQGYQGYVTLEWEKQWHPEIEPPEVAFPQYAEGLRAWL